MRCAHAKILTRIFVLLSLTLMAGCGGGSVAPSSWYPSDSIYAYMEVVQKDNDNITTTVQLRNGPESTAAYLYLVEDESLYTSLNISPQQYLNFSDNLFGNSKELSQNLKVMSTRDLYSDFLLFTQTSWGNPEYYSEDMLIPSSAPIRAYVTFERDDHKLTGESSIELPPSFHITTPFGGASVSRANPVTLTWSNVDATSAIELDVAGICADDSRFTKKLLLGADTGSITLNSADYFPTTSPSINCFVAFKLNRVRTGSVSSRFAFGSIRGIQQRTLQFNSTP